VVLIAPGPMLDDPGLAEVGLAVRPETPAGASHGTGLCLIFNARAAQGRPRQELADQGLGPAQAGSSRFHPPPSAL